MGKTDISGSFLKTKQRTIQTCSRGLNDALNG